MVKENRFEPKIVAFICNWCAYGAADLAGVSRMQYPPNVQCHPGHVLGNRIPPSSFSGPCKAARTVFWWAGDTSVTAITCTVIT